MHTSTLTVEANRITQMYVIVYIHTMVQQIIIVKDFAIIIIVLQSLVKIIPLCLLCCATNTVQNCCC